MQRRSLMWGTELWTLLEDLDICDYRRDPGLLGPAPQCCLMRVESCSIFVFLCMEAGWWVLPQSHLSSTDTMFKMAFASFFSPPFWLFLTCYFGMVLLWTFYNEYKHTQDCLSSSRTKQFCISELVSFFIACAGWVIVFLHPCCNAEKAVMQL